MCYSLTIPCDQAQYIFISILPIYSFHSPIPQKGRPLPVSLLSLLGCPADGRLGVIHYLVDGISAALSVYVLLVDGREQGEGLWFS